MGEKSVPNPKPPPNLTPYRGRWIAYLGERVIGQGGTPNQAICAAKATRHKEKPRVIYVPMQKPFTFSPLFESVQKILASSPTVYLVGGAIRDTMLSNPIHDLDFVLPADTFLCARKVANQLGGAFYPLDKERETARVIITNGSGQRQIIDFAAFRGDTLEDDLRARDFTINAMAVSLQNPTALLDPLGGAADLREGILRSCSEHTFQDDPLRILRAVRQAAQFNLHITSQTRSQIKKAAGHITNVSPERLRDELFRILDGPKQSSALKALELLGAFSHLFPEKAQFSLRAQRTLQYLETLLNLLGEKHDPEVAANWMRGLVVLRLGRYRSELSSHLGLELVSERSLAPLLFLAATYTENFSEENAETPNLEPLIRRAHALHLSNAETAHLQAALRAVKRFWRLSLEPQPPNRREIYRYFHKVGKAGVDAIFLALADFLALHGTAPPKDAWAKQLDWARTLLEAWWEHHAEQISPPALLTGIDLMNALEISPGPLVGELLEIIREAQAAGEISTRTEALAHVRQLPQTQS
ncbi:MAG: hypothetical protein DRI56_09645 [Chloroflexota bacterium]|nr:MAG: hypothetical protein B6243_00690 [Anaerolineaceae bacterium 4572_5.2]RLD05436.1 MAG: hypothetical protein DRI56_09645 [Chloroflexota bacterium]